MTNKELSMMIREDLKKAGIPKAAYSIRVRDCTYDTSVDVRVKDVMINLDRVNKVLDKYESVRWDEHAQEILAGCNTYVHASYDNKMLDLEREAFMDRAEELMKMDIPLYVGEVVATFSRNGHESELLFFKGDRYMAARKKGGTTNGNTRHYAGSVHSIANALTLFNNLGALPKY